jgi:RND family efflux transporter MFP subunit
VTHELHHDRALCTNSPSRIRSCRRIGSPAFRGGISRLFAIALLVPLTGCSPPDRVSADSGPLPLPVKVSMIATDEWVEKIHSFALIESAEVIDLSVDFPATILRTTCHEGDGVQKGVVLFELDAERRTLLVRMADAAVLNAEATFAEAGRNLERKRNLFQQGGISVALIDAAALNHTQASAALESTLAERALRRRDLTEQHVVNRVAGRIESCLVEAGETVLPGQVMARVHSLGAVRAVTHISERHVNHVRIGDPADVEVVGVPSRLYIARVESVGVSADPRTGNFPVKLAIDNSDGLIRSGMTARVSLRGLIMEDAILVPDSAVVNRDRRKVVFVVVDGIAIEVRPRFHTGSNETLLAITGLSPGDLLIVNGQERVVDGAPVLVAD